MEALLSLKNRTVSLTLFSSVVLLGFTQSSFAAQEEAPPVGDGFSVYGMLFQVMFFLLLIIGLFFVIIKFIAKKNKQFSTGRAVKNLGGVALGQNKSVQIVEIGNSLFVLGVGDNVQLISQISDPDEIEQIRDNMAPKAPVDLQSFTSFAKWVRSLRKKEQTEEELPASFHELFADRMKQVSGRKERIDELTQDEYRADRLNDNK
ncbi:flagellar biosynthetic protein FliO [Paenibacillus sp. MBLB4367]|uniref:flagellar biosynthetic protein FliO n=1 Tax=Paenibacillus sp. MBLB4367 TaxID=3384767 RepID=UPI0039081DB6